MMFRRRIDLLLLEDFKPCLPLIELVIKKDHSVEHVHRA